MFTEKKVVVGIDGNYITLKEAFNRNKRGKLTIVLTSDVLDDEDIEIPSSLDYVHIKTIDNKQIIFCKEYMTIYCNGVMLTLENIGKKETDICIIGTQKKTKKVFLELKQCKVDYVIGAMDVQEIKCLYLKLVRSEAYVVTGVFNHNQAFNCESLEIDVIRSEIDTLQGLNIRDYKCGLIQQGRIVVDSCTVKEVNLVKGDYQGNGGYPLKLTMIGNSTVKKQIT